MNSPSRATAKADEHRAGSPPAPGPRLEVDDLVVAFGAHRALDGVSLSFGPGTIVGLVGPNGAGKSTLGKVLVGEIPHGAYTGRVRLDGRQRQFANSRSAHEAGIVLVHQEGAAITQLSIGENVLLTIEPQNFGVVRWNDLYTRAGAALGQMGVKIADPRRPLGEEGGVALKGLMEIARSIVRGSRVLIFDESTAALAADDIAALLKQLRDLAASGAIVIFISHRINEILNVCDRVVVLRDGRVVLDEPRGRLDHDKVVRSMLGSQFSAYAARVAGSAAGDPATSKSDPRLRVADWRVAASADGGVGVGPIAFDLHGAEILGVYGALGAGKTELLSALYGLLPAVVSGSMVLDGRALRPFRSVREAIRHGFALVSAERQKDGVVAQLSVLENMMLGYQNAALQRFGRLDLGAARQLCESFIAEMGIVTRGPDEPIGALSGGNQQKVLLARALIASPKILLLDEPTRGIDVGAKEDVYRWIRSVAARGTAVILSSLEEGEVLGLAHRILILRDGAQVATLARDEADERRLMSLASGGETP